MIALFHSKVLFIALFKTKFIIDFMRKAFNFTHFLLRFSEEGLLLLQRVF